MHMSVVLVTGSSGLVGSAVVSEFHERGFTVLGIDNDQRATFFGKQASTQDVTAKNIAKFRNFLHESVDIRDWSALERLFKKYGRQIEAVVHCAAQPSHDWSATDPATDFAINAVGTLNVCELTRSFSPDATIVHMSTNKVYGDSPNKIELEELGTRFEPVRGSPYFSHGIDEKMSIDASMHSPFGVSKASADLIVQEYGRYFEMKTVVLRGGCLTGPLHRGAELHGFLSYLVKCTVWGEKYTVFGYKGKQVRDNIHSRDLASAIWEAYISSGNGEVYNIGGSRFSNVSLLEAVQKVETISARKLDLEMGPNSRKGDHKWYVSDIRKFEVAHPSWRLTVGIDEILEEMVSFESSRKSG